MRNNALRIGICFVVMFVALVAFSRVSYAGEKYAFVELRALFDDYNKTKDADAEIAEIAKEKQAQRDALVEGIRKIKDEMALYAEGSEEQAKNQVAIDEKIKELQAFDEATKTSLRTKRDEMVKVIFDDINAEIQAFGEKKGYDFIFGDRSLVYKNEKYNLTKEILEKLNK